LARALPQAHFVYVGDTARLPYGNRSRAEIGSYVQEIVGFLSDFRLDAVVMACNTSAALAQDVAFKCAREAGFEVFTLIAPTARHIGRLSLNRVGVLATWATANSRAFRRALEVVNFGGEVVEVGCPKLVPLIESGRLGEAEIEIELALALEEYLVQLAGAEAIVLGCTHYPFIADRIEALLRGPLKASFPASVAILDPAVILSSHLQGLAEIDFAPIIRSDCVGSLAETRMEIFATGDGENFSRIARVCLGEGLSAVKALSLNQLAKAGLEAQSRQAISCDTSAADRSERVLSVMIKTPMAADISFA